MLSCKDKSVAQIQLVNHMELKIATLATKTQNSQIKPFSSEFYLPKTDIFR